MRCYSLVLSTGLLAASAWIPGSDSFLFRHKINSGISETNIPTSSSNFNADCRKIQTSMKATSVDVKTFAREAEAKKICPLLPPPEDIHATFEAAMG